MTGTEELQDAILELQQYLSDHKAPLMVADSVELLLQFPADFMAKNIHAWVAGQALSAPVADYLYHGAKKLCLLGELELLPRDALGGGYLAKLAEALVSYCPEPDRDLLKQNLERLGQAVVRPVAAPAVLHRQDGDQVAGSAPPAAPPAFAREARRLSLLLEHLRPMAASAAPPEQRSELASQFMTSAAAQAASLDDLDRHLAPLRELGIDTATEALFRTLARSLAGWLLPRVEGQAAPASEQLSAMHRLVSLAQDPAEAAKRFRELVHAALEQFNEGHLGRAATMFELAERLAAEQQIKPVFIEALRTQGHEYLKEERLRRYAERPEYRPQLRTILGFFTALQPMGLLRALNGEPSRERRHHLLALLETHEQAAREAVWQLLLNSVEPGAHADPFFQMNLVYLLRIIARPPEASVEEEVNAVMATAGRSSPAPLVKQIIAYLAHTRHEKAERALITYLKVFENMLLQADTSAYPPAELEVLLDRTCAALARYGSPRAWRVLIDHGLKSEARLGSPFLRLAEAGRVDLSSSPELVQRIAEAITAELPRGGMLGLVGKKDESKAVSLISALAGTAVPEVQKFLEEIATRFAGRPAGDAAARALAAQAAAGKPATPPALTGDLDFFGLPNLLQTIHQSTLSGILSVLGPQGSTEATLLFDKGSYRGGQCGAVLGGEAVYQLLEKPFSGTFAFVSRSDIDSHPRAGPPRDVLALVLEGVRRHDELKRAAAVAPDQTQLVPTGQPHSAPEDEDPDFVTFVWSQASRGGTPAAWESESGTDSYRVRRVVARWVEEGALRAA